MYEPSPQEGGALPRRMAPQAGGFRARRAALGARRAGQTVRADGASLAVLTLRARARARR